MITDLDVARWVRHARSPEQPRVRLLCFAHAGGGASTYRGWPRRLGVAGIDVWPIQLPGREHRVSEPPFVDLTALTDELCRVLGEELQSRPYALFGHSAGATVAYGLALAAKRHGLPAPRRLFLSAQRPPTHPDRDAPVHGWDIARLTEKLHRYGGMPSTVDEAFLELTLPAIRADFQLFETARWPAAVQLDCPVTVVGGATDAEVPASLLPAWRSVTRGGFDVQVLPGGHFRPPAAEQRLMEVIVDGLV